MPEQFWLYQFIDGLELKTTEAAAAALASPEVLEYAIDLAGSSGENDRPDPEAAVLASRDADLSGLLTCAGFECLVSKIEDAFSQVWHYFDCVVVESAAPGRFLREVSDAGGVNDALLAYIYDQISVLLHLRQIGAEPYLHFVEKPFAFCETHYQHHAKEIGLPAATDSDTAEKVVAYLVAEGSLEEVDPLFGDATAFLFQHPFLDGGMVWHSRPGAEVTLEAVARRLFAQHCLGFIGDAAMSREWGVPIASPVNRVVDVSSSVVTGDFSDQVALNLNLPVFRGVPLETLLRLRRDFGDEFVRFRAALRKSINDIALGDEPTDPQNAAQRVWRDHLEPAVADIESRLRSARRVAGAKSVQNVALGAAQVGIGLVFQTPLLIGTGLTTAGAAITHASRYVDDRNDVELSQMHFLWRVAKHRHGAR